MKKIFTFIILTLLTAMYIDAQGLKITPRHIEQTRNMRNAKAKQRLNPSIRTANNPLEEFTEIVNDPQYDDIRYRYVFSYDKDLQRVSETIYESKKEDGIWSSETFLTMGSYTYGYDIQGRVNMKKVTYEPEPENSPLSSYYITISYDDAGVANYHKYLKSDDEYYLDETWAYYSDGSLATHQYDIAGDYYGSDYYAVEYDENGVVTMFSNSQYRKDLYSGALNASTITSMENYNDAWETTRIKSYKYDNKFGVLTEYSIVDEYNDTEKVVIAYDGFGRISSIKKYGKTSSSDGMIGGDSNVMDKLSVSTDEPTWELEYSETYTYANDEVYTVGNSWHDVLGFDGPIATTLCEDFDSEYSTVITFNRNDSGKIISVDYNSSDLSYDSGATISIDADGRITAIVRNDYSETYSWEGDVIVKSVSNDMGWIVTTIFEQGDGWHKAKLIDGEDLSSTSYEICEVRKSDNKQIVTYDSYYSGELEESYSERFILETQQEDVAFVRPYINKDMEGMTVEEPIIISQTGRVICSAKDIDYSSASGNPSIFSLNEYTDLGYIVPNAIEEVDDYYGLNLGVAIYYSVDHSGNNTICRNADGLPVFVLDGNRLIKEYIYYKESFIANGGSSPSIEPTSVSISSGYAYDEISYIYDTDGTLQGQTVVSVDSNGSKTEEINIEYKYIEESGIEAIEIDAKPSAILSGRTLGFKAGEKFSVYTLDGRQIAYEVTSLTLPAAGIYIVDVTGQTLKLHVK